MTSPTQRTLKFLRDIGAVARVVEHWNGYAKRRIDLWGADILAKQGRLLMAVQTTSDANHSSRVEKSKVDPDVRNWLDTGVGFYVISWGKKGARGKRKLWTVRISQLVLNLPDDNIIVLTHGSEIPSA